MKLIALLVVFLLAVADGFLIGSLLSDSWKPTPPKCKPLRNFDVECSKQKFCFDHGHRAGVPVYKSCLDENLSQCWIIFYHVDRWFQLDLVNHTLHWDVQSCLSDEEVDKFVVADCKVFQRGACRDNETVSLNVVPSIGDASVRQIAHTLLYTADNKANERVLQASASDKHDTETNVHLPDEDKPSAKYRLEVKREMYTFCHRQLRLFTKTTKLPDAIDVADNDIDNVLKSCQVALNTELSKAQPL